MKRFKNTFGVTGSAKQLEAFAEWAEGIGWRFNDRGYSHRENRKSIYFGAKASGVMNDGEYRYASISNIDAYSLPSQWSEAMAAASEVEETVFEVGKKYTSGHGFVVLCTSSAGDKPELFSGVVISGDARPIGDYSERWYAPDFTPYNEPVTI